MVGFLFGMDKQRKLLIVPIVHTKEDMGSLGGRIPVGNGYSSMTQKFWEEVKARLKKYINGAKRLKVYQDGLPDTKMELVDRIIEDVESPNYKLLRLLKEKGAKVLGTEDPRLIRKEYEFIYQIFGAKDEETKNRIRKVYEGQGSELLARRDSYIAGRIDRTLKKGDLGILFIGAAHEVVTKLPKDIQIEIL